MSAFYNLPDEVTGLIHQFAGNYKRNYRKVRQQFTLATTLHILRSRLVEPRTTIAFGLQNPEVSCGCHRAPTCRNDGVYHHIQVSVAEHLYYPADMIRMFKHLKACRCCVMHRENRPRRIDGIWDEQPLAATYGTCKCACRHYMRVLSKAYMLP